MNKIFSILITFALLTGCKGEQGDIGPDGQTGDTGAVGPNGQTGAKGPTGEKGVSGAPGVVGEKGDTGVTPNVKVFYTDWENLSAWSADATNAYKYIYKNDSKSLSFLPDYKTLSVTYFSNSGGFLVTKETTSEPVGYLYVYTAVKNIYKDANNFTVFTNEYNGSEFKALDSSNGFFDLEGNSVVPVLSRLITITFSKEKFNSNNDFKGVIAEIAPKSRMVFIPQGLASGRLKALTYEQMLAAFDIPAEGASK